MTRAGPLEIDRQLALAASKLGRLVSDWQVKRWRESGLLPTRKPGLGQKLGSAPAQYLANSAEHAACLADALGCRKSLDEACLRCFWLGFSPRERALKAAYRRQFTTITKWIEQFDTTDDHWETAGRIATRLARRSGTHQQTKAARTRLRAAKKGSLLRDAIENLLALILGRHGRLNNETLLAFGAQGLTVPLTNGQPLAEPSDLELDWLTLEALTDKAETSPLVVLEQARDALRFLLDYLKQFVWLLKRTRNIDLTPLLAFFPDDAGCALLVPAVMLLRCHLGAETFDRNLEQLREQYPRLLAINRLLDQLPADLHHLVGKAAISIALLSDSERERMVDAVQAYISQHPEELPLLADESDQ